MTLLPRPSAYPGGQKITIATSFKVLSHSNDTDRNFGMGINGKAVAGDGFKTLRELNQANGYIPLFEWGYGSQAGVQEGVFASTPGVNRAYDIQSMCSLGLTTHTVDLVPVPDFSVSAAFSGPFTNSTDYGDISGTYWGPRAPYDSSYGQTGDFWFPTMLQNCFSVQGTPTKPGWVDGALNFLLVSADLSVADTPQHNNPFDDAELTNVIQGAKIWMNLNNVFDTTAVQPGGSYGNFLTPSLSDGSGFYQGFFIVGTTGTINTPVADVAGAPLTMMAGEFAMPCLEAHASSNYNYATVVYGPTQVWFDLYIAPTPENYAKFFYITADNILRPAADIRAAANAFGQPDIWFVRDSVSGVKFEDNQGTAGDFTVIGTAPKDYKPGPELGIQL